MSMSINESILLDWLGRDYTIRHAQGCPDRGLPGLDGVGGVDCMDTGDEVAEAGVEG